MIPHPERYSSIEIGFLTKIQFSLALPRPLLAKIAVSLSASKRIPQSYHYALTWLHSR
jgi:hypothetical protein